MGDYAESVSLSVAQHKSQYVAKFAKLKIGLRRWKQSRQLCANFFLIQSRA